jgi:hypothetical protein
MGIQKEIGIGDLGRGETTLKEEREEIEGGGAVGEDGIPADAAVVHGDTQGEGKEVREGMRVGTQMVEVGEMAWAGGVVQEGDGVGLVAGHVAPEEVRTKGGGYGGVGQQTVKESGGIGVGIVGQKGGVLGKVGGPCPLGVGSLENGWGVRVEKEAAPSRGRKAVEVGGETVHVGRTDDEVFENIERGVGEFLFGENVGGVFHQKGGVDVGASHTHPIL